MSFLDKLKRFDDISITKLREIPAVRSHSEIVTLFKEYKNSTWTQPELSNFVSTNIHQVSAWLSPPGSKSTTLAPYLKRGPAVLLFTPRIHYAISTDAYTMVRFLSIMMMTSILNTQKTFFSYDKSPSNTTTVQVITKFGFKKCRNNI